MEYAERRTFGTIALSQQEPTLLRLAASVEAGVVLQLDDPGLPDSWDTANPEPSVGKCKKFRDSAGRGT